MSRNGLDQSLAYASHLEATAMAAIKSGLLWPRSPVIELGCGDFSTPVLASICFAQERPYQIISSDPVWAARFKYLTLRGVEIEHINYAAWPEAPLPDDIGLVLVDNEQRVSDRLEQVVRLANRAKVVLLHDANIVLRRRQLWKSVIDRFRYNYVFRRRVPYTAVLSNHVDPAPWFSTTLPPSGYQGAHDVREYDEPEHPLETAFARGWHSGGDETMCGEGSTVWATEGLRREWPSIVERFHIRTVNDAGCGDLNWQSLLDLTKTDYQGYDVVRWPTWNRPDRTHLACEVADFTNTPLRACDLTLCRDAMIHLPNHMIVDAIANFRASSTYLLATSFDGLTNDDRIEQPGGFSRLDLTAAPFCLGEPLARIDEPFPNKYLGLWRLRSEE